MDLEQIDYCSPSWTHLSNYIYTRLQYFTLLSSFCFSDTLAFEECWGYTFTNRHYNVVASPCCWKLCGWFVGNCFFLLGIAVQNARNSPDQRLKCCWKWKHIAWAPGWSSESLHLNETHYSWSIILLCTCRSDWTLIILSSTCFSTDFRVHMVWPREEGYVLMCLLLPRVNTLSCSAWVSPSPGYVQELVRNPIP